MCYFTNFWTAWPIFNILGLKKPQKYKHSKSALYLKRKPPQHIANCNFLFFYFAKMPILTHNMFCELFSLISDFIPTIYTPRYHPGTHHDPWPMIPRCTNLSKAEQSWAKLRYITHPGTQEVVSYLTQLWPHLACPLQREKSAMLSALSACLTKCGKYWIICNECSHR